MRRRLPVTQDDGQNEMMLVILHRRLLSITKDHRITGKKRNGTSAA